MYFFELSIALSRASTEHTLFRCLLLENRKVVVGSTSKPLTELLEGCDQPYDDQPSTSSSSSSNSLPAKSQIPWPSWPLSRWPVTWSGWLPLTHAPAEDKTGKAAGAALAGALMGGPMGAAMAGGAALLWNKEVKGRVLVDLSYQPLEVANVKPQQGSSRSSGNDDGSALSKKEENIDKTEEEVHQPRPPKGGTPGLDWGDLALGMNVAESASKLEFCAFVDTSETDTQAALWRDSEAKRLVVNSHALDQKLQSAQNHKKERSRNENNNKRYESWTINSTIT